MVSQNSLTYLLVWCLIVWCVFGFFIHGRFKTFIYSSPSNFQSSNGNDVSQEEMLPTFDLDCTFTKKRAITQVKVAGHSLTYRPDTETPDIVNKSDANKQKETTDD
uniref:Secreted protein n=1 Tax=Plectus sambesii TaxID=2011161 RepID=A0A914V091_9BILA